MLTIFPFHARRNREAPEIAAYPTICVNSGDLACETEALCILLRRFVYPSRWNDPRKFFGRSEASVCRIFQWTLNHVDSKFCWLLEEWNQGWLSEEDFYLFEGAISAKGGALRGFFGLTDGTARSIARPGRMQRDCFSGHKRLHYSKWLSVVVPNGMICSLHGGHRGSMHDSFSLTTSKVIEAVQVKIASFEQQHAFCIHGDSGHARDDIIKKPFSKAEIMADQLKRTLNKARVRESVE